MKPLSQFSTIACAVRDAVVRWNQDGERKCLEILKPHIFDADKHDAGFPGILTSAFFTLVQSLLKLYVARPLATSQLVSFLHQLLDGLPSTSDSPPDPNRRLGGVIGELLVDVYWSVETQIEEQLNTMSKSAVGAEAGSDKNQDESRRCAEEAKEVLYGFLRELLQNRIVEARICRERLDIPSLSAVNLIGDSQAMTKKEIRMRTTLFYKQNKFNLLREQSEGYTKLFTELIQSVGTPHSSSTALPVECQSVIDTRARAAWDKVIGLIGYFDLDPSRALDITLDVLSTHITMHYSFFLALLRASTWHRSQVPQNLVSSMDVDDTKGSRYKGMNLDQILMSAEADHLLQPKNPNKAQVCAEVLGFKFVHYQNADVKEETPKTLYTTAALLIREGIIILEDLYPHLSPSDQEMESIYHQRYKSSISDRVAAAKVNALAIAAPLTDDAHVSASKLRPAGPETIKKDPETKEVPNQKLGLLIALLSLGAIRPSISILTEFPWMPAAYPDVADLFMRLLRMSMQPLYEKVCHPNVKYVPSNTMPRPRYGVNGVGQPPPRKRVVTFLAPLPPDTANSEFVFFYPSWDRLVPRCTDHEDVKLVLVPLLQYVGIHISRDLEFVTKLCKIGKLQLTVANVADDVKDLWVRITREFLLPTISLQRASAVCSVEIWIGILRNLDVETRWSLYGEWKQSLYKKHPEMRVAFVEADREAKGVLRRLSSKNISQMSRNIAKLCYSNPCIIFTNIIKQVESYENMAATIIDAFRYLVNMSFDVLSYVLMEAFTDPSKQRIKSDGTNASLWLQSLAAFTGAVHKKYTFMDPEHVLRYIAHQLRNSQTNDLIVLQELIYRMTGIKPLVNETESQIAAMAGGPMLRIEAVASEERGALEERPQLNAKSRDRLLSSLQSSSLSLPLLVLIAQHRQTCVFSSQEDHLKSIASSYDTVQGILFQYIELLSSLLPSDGYAQLLPSVYDLCCTYGLDLPTTMEIYRPKLHITIFAHAQALQEKTDAGRIADTTEAERRLKAKILQQKKTQEQSPAAINSELPPEGNPVAGNHTPSPPLKVRVDFDLPLQKYSKAEMKDASLESPWLPILEPIIADVRRVLPLRAVQVMGAAFYVTFWQMSLYDLDPPSIRYKQEGTRLLTLSNQANENVLSQKDVSSNKARRERLNTTHNLLMKEMKEQIIAREFTIKRLQREKDHWFTTGDRADLATQIIQYCIHPRSLLSPMDAGYCVQMIRALHAMGTPGFSTLMCYDKLLGDHVSAVVFSCTANEARSYGRFLLGILRDISSWHKDEKVYLRDNKDKRGSMLPGFQRAKTEKKSLAPEDLYTWDQFKQIHNKWHKKLAVNLAACLASGEYMHIHNAIVILQELMPVFPVGSVNYASGTAISEAMAKCIEVERRSDLKILAGAYYSQFLRAKAVWEAPAAPAVSLSKPPPTRPSSSNAPGAATQAEPVDAIQNGSSSVKRSVPTVVPPTVRLPNGSAIHSTKVEEARSSNVRETSDGERVAAAVKLALESIPRPEVVKRIRPDVRSATSTPQPESSVKQDTNPPSSSGPPKEMSVLDSTSVDTRSEVVALQPSYPLSTPGAKGDNQQKVVVQKQDDKTLSTDARSTQPEVAAQSSTVRKDLPQSPRGSRSVDDTTPRHPPPQDMPPPSAPSSTPLAYELRTSAKRGDERSDTKVARGSDTRPLSRPPSRPPSRGSGRAATPPLTRRRSLSPPSRGGPADGRSERPVDVDRAERVSSRGFQPRQDRILSRSGQESDRIDRSPRDRPTMHRDTDRMRDLDRDRERDRERDRDREKERDRVDRHRRDWDKERDGSGSRKDRDIPITREVLSHPRRETPQEDLPTGPDLSRSRPIAGSIEDSLGKRRRLPEEDADRSSKRSTRHKDASYRDERGSRHKGDRERDRPRDSDRSRRRERDPDTSSQGDGRILSETQERPADQPGGGKHTQAPPSAPRAMADTPSRPSRNDFTTSRVDGRGRGWSASGRDNGASNLGNRMEGGNYPSNGLRSRMDESPHQTTYSGPPQRNEPPLNGDRGAFRDEARSHEIPRKRTFSDRGREKDEGDTGVEGNQPPKRLRINRTSRYALDDAMQKSSESSRQDGKADTKATGRSGKKD